MSAPPPIVFGLISDNAMREELFQSLPSYAADKDRACYTRWAKGCKFSGCKENCGCPRSRITQAEVDAFRDQLTTTYIKEFEESMVMLHRVKTTACAKTVSDKMWQVACCSKRGHTYVENAREVLQASIDRDQATSEK